MDEKREQHETPSIDRAPDTEAHEPDHEVEDRESDENIKSESPDIEEPDKDLSKTVSKSSKKSINDIGAVPNGGLVAWLQVLGGFMLFFNSWGILNTFGIYQTYYESGQLFDSNSSNISWIGSIQSYLLLLVGAVTGPIYDAGHFKALVVTGSFLIVFGHMMLSLCHEFYQALLAQAFCVGIGAGCLFVPSVSLMPTYFTTRIATAIGIAASGSSIGGVIYPIVFYRLIDRIGFGWTVRVIGFIALGTLSIPIAVMKMRVKPSAKRRLIDWSAFKEPAYVTFIFFGMLGFIGLYVTVFYISFYGLAKRLTTPEISFYLVPIFNAASTFGRIIPNIIADKTGPLNVLVPATTITGVLSFCLLAAKNSAGLIVLAAFYGFFSGTFVSLPPSVIVSVTKNRAVIGTRMGMAFTVLGLGSLAGGPGAGGILGDVNTDMSNLNWTGTWVFSGVTIIAAAAGFALCREFKTGWKLWGKA